MHFLDEAGGFGKTTGDKLGQIFSCGGAFRNFMANRQDQARKISRGLRARSPARLLESPKYLRRFALIGSIILLSMAMTIPPWIRNDSGRRRCSYGLCPLPLLGDTRKAMRRKSLSVAFKSLFLVSVLSNEGRFEICPEH